MWRTIVRTQLKVILFVCPIILFSTYPAFSSHFTLKKYNTNIYLTGMILYGANWVDIDGTTGLMLGGVESLDAGHTSLGKASLLVKGTLFQLPGKEPWTVSGNIFYDSRNFVYDVSTEGHFRQETTFQVKVEHINTHLLFGDFQTAFADLNLARPFVMMRGAELHFEPGNSDRLQLSFFAAKMRTGLPLKQEYRGNGTSGYFYLDSIPVKILSETVRVETRDRDEVTKVIKTEFKIRGIDYMIDYQTGRLMFTQEVIMPETFEGNPIYIMITYESDKGDNKPYVGGGRAVVKPSNSVSIGTSYLFQNQESSLSSPDNRLLGADLRAEIGDRFTLTAEFARSSGDKPGLGGKPDRNALLADVLWRAAKKVHFQGFYRRISDDFSPVGLLQNTSLISNKEEVQGFFRYRITEKNFFSIGQRWFHDNVRRIEGTLINYGSAIFAETSFQFTNSLLRAGYEYRFDWDNANPRTVNTRTHIPYLAYSRNFSKAFGADFRYEPRFTRDLTGKVHNRSIHLFDVKLRSNVSKDLIAYVWPKFGLERDSSLGENKVRKLGAEVGFNGKIANWLRTVSIFNYIDEEDLLEGLSDRVTKSLSLLFDITPSDKFKTLAKFENSSQQSPGRNSSFSTRTIDVRSYYHPSNKSTLFVTLEQRRDENRQPDVSGISFTERDWTRLTAGARHFVANKIALTGEIGIKWNFNLRESPSEIGLLSSETNTRNYFFLGGTDVFWYKWLDTVLQYKRVWTEGAVENSRHSIVTEIGFEIYKGVRLYVGNEYVVYAEGEFLELEDSDYKANRFYFKIMKKF